MRQQAISFSIVAAVLSTAIIPAANAQAPNFTGIGELSGNGWGSHANGVSFNGTFVTGQSPRVNYPETLRWSNPINGGAGLEPLYSPAWANNGSHGVAISDDGLIVAGNGSIYSPPSLTSQAFRWTDPASGGIGFVSIGSLPGPYPLSSVSAGAMSADGAVLVGGSVSFDQVTGVFQQSAFRWELTNPATGAGVMIELGHLPGGGVQPYYSTYATAVSADGTVIVGTSETPTGRQAFRWENGVMTGLGFLPGGVASDARAISADGTTVIGRVIDSTNEQHSFKWTAATGMQPLPRLVSNYETSAMAVSGDGSIVVGSSSTSVWNINEAMIWDDVHGARKLSSVLVNEYRLDLGDFELMTAIGISADGRTIVGNADNPRLNEEGFDAFLGDVCYADCDTSTGVGVLDVFDFLCFQNSFVSGEPYACDCDTSTGNGVCDVFDFLCFQNAFVGGCP